MSCPKFQIGNVVKHGSSIFIVTDVRSDSIKWVSLTDTNSSGHSFFEDKVYQKDCECCDIYGVDQAEECDICDGRLTVDRVISGCKNATILARNVREYIENRLLKNFEFYNFKG